jgi:hypothetical protein
MWMIVFVCASVALGTGLAHLLGEELTAFQSRRQLRKMERRLNDAAPIVRNAYAGFDEDRLLSNRSERWD